MARGINAKLKNLKCLFYDFDGVMTDNRVGVCSNGTESVVCHRGDGWAVRRFKELGLQQYILTTETNDVVKRRAEKLKIPCLVASDDKKRALAEFSKQHRIDLDRSAYFGNDQNDFAAMMMVGLKVAPADAWPPVKNKADLVTLSAGGHGVIREFLDYYEEALQAFKRTGSTSIRTPRRRLS